MHVRTSKAKDVARIVEIDALFYGDEGLGLYAVHQFLDLFPQSAFVCEEGDTVIGHAIVGIEGLSRRCWLLAIAVDRAHQSKGAGTALMERCVGYCESIAAERCALTVKTDNPAAISLYEKYGFATVDGPLDYYGDGQMRIVMERRWER